MPFNNTVTDDDWESGTIAAAFGGTTTIFDFCISAGETKLEMQSKNGIERQRIKPLSTMDST